MDTLIDLDLDRETREALEFDELLGRIAAHASTPAAASWLASVRPLVELQSVRRELTAVEAVRRQLAAAGRLLPARLPDATAAVEALEVDELVLESLPLRALALVLRAAADARLAIERAAVSETLVREATAIADLRPVVRPMLDGIDADGGLLDEASSELRRIRASRGRTSDRLHRQLRELLHDPASRSIIRDDFVTRRNGRFVIPVRTDAPRPLPGIVHASSSTGATRFVEPLESVDLNNDLVRLDEDELAEIRRILAAWTGLLRARRDEVRVSIDALVRLDTLQARAIFADDVRSATTSIDPDAPLLLRQVRHPLLERHLAQEGSAIVPLDLELDPAHQVLVISGPNTGGKTVALKTIGLAVLMAQSGIPVPAAEARLPLFRQVRADIGDRQSIEADLSTYSAHVRAVRRFLRDRRPPALILFDEMGTGTEPSEGAALGQAVLEQLVEPGITAIATTHLGALKTWAFTGAGSACAAMEFDRASHRPTFRILMGTAGASAGLDIAAGLGVPAAVVERARTLMDPVALRNEGQLARLRELVTQNETKIAALDAERSALEERRRELESEVAFERDRWRRQADSTLQRGFDEWRDESRRLLRGAQDAAEKDRLRRELARAERALKVDLARRRTELGVEPSAEAREPLEAEPQPGMRVHVASLARDGEIASLRGERVDVRLGGVVFTVARADLRRADPPTAADSRHERVRVRMPIGHGPVPSEINLVGRQVEPALEQLDKYLDEAVVAGHETIRVIHGHGTGRLRTAVRRFLREHRHVDRVSAGGAGEGGEGATVARLR